MSFWSSWKNKAVIWVWNNTMTCKDVTRLASQSLDQPLPFITRLRMRLHMLICVWCERYAAQIKSLHEAMPHFEEHADAASAKSLPGDAKERIKRALQESDSGH